MFTEMKVKQNISQHMHGQKYFIIFSFVSAPSSHVKRAVLVTVFCEA